MTNKKPVISIILPIYKVEQYLRHCLKSIQEQTFTDFEVLMVDDGSPDGSGAICVEFQQQDPRFHYYRKVNGGAASARNYALKLAQGEYLAFIDSDDYLNKDYLQALYHQVEVTGCDIAISSYFMQNEKGKFFVPMNPNGGDETYNGVYRPAEWIREFFNRDGMIYTAPWAKLFSRKVFHNLFFPAHVNAGDDQFTIWRAYSHADTISFDNQQNYCYVMNSNSLSHVKVSAFQFGVTCLEDQIATFQMMGWDASYMIPLYRQRVHNVNKMALQKGDISKAKHAQWKMAAIKKYS